jgi:chemotaxis protein CheX
MIDVDSLLDSFRETTLHVITSIAQVELVPGRMCFSSEYEHKCDIIGNISLTGEGRLSLSLRFSNEAVESIYKAVFPDESENIDASQIGDLVGEITNMVCGNARNILAELGMKFEASIPVTIIGAQQIYHPLGTISRMIPVEVNGNPMSIEVSIKEDD